MSFADNCLRQIQDICFVQMMTGIYIAVLLTIIYLTEGNK